MAKLSPGERAINWAKAVAIIIPLFGVGVFAGNTDVFHNWVKGADDIVPSEAGFNEQVIHAIEKINDKLAEQDALIGKLKSRDYSDQKKLQTQIDDIKKLVN
jgi:hypothetical protein